jgi:hypothetical protein
MARAQGRELSQVARDAKIFSAPVSIELGEQIECQAIEFLRQSFLADGGLE